jgi:hypothetical protein
MGILIVSSSKEECLGEEEMKRREKAEVEEACGKVGSKVF